MGEAPGWEEAFDSLYQSHKNGELCGWEIALAERRVVKEIERLRADLDSAVNERNTYLERLTELRPVVDAARVYLDCDGTSSDWKRLCNAFRALDAATKPQHLSTSAEGSIQSESSDNHQTDHGLDAFADSEQRHQPAADELPDSTEVCQTCGGTGHSLLPDDELYTVESSLPCPTCNGTGIESLIVTGRGEVKELAGKPCPTCNGKQGWWSDGGKRYDTCPDCQGTGGR